MNDLERQFDFLSVEQDIRSGQEANVQAAMEALIDQWEGLNSTEQQGLVRAFQAAHEMNPELSDAHAQSMVFGLKDSNPALAEEFLRWMEASSSSALQTRAAKLRASNVKGILSVR